MAIEYCDESWSIDCSAEEKCLHVSTSDYHAGPLKLSVDQLRGLLNVLDPSAMPMQRSPEVCGVPLTPVEKIQGQSNDPSASSSGAHVPFLVVSKRDKCLYIDVPSGWTGLLKLSRKELYRYGKKMGKRGRVT